MDPLVALGDHEPNTEERGALRRPVAAGAAAVLLACQDRERHTRLPVTARGVEHRHEVAVGEIRGPRTLGPWRHLVSEPDVRERPAHHDLVVTAACAVAVELRR